MNKIERSKLPIDSDLLRTFVTVAERKNLTHAAQAIGRTQSAVSVQIKKLEALLAVKLFKREARGMSLSPEGEQLLQTAQRLIHELDRIGVMFSKPLIGRVRVGIPDDYETDVLEKILASFSTQHPDVEIEVCCYFSVRFPLAIERDELDLAVYACHPTDNLGRRLHTEQTVWVAGKYWPLEADKPIPLALYDKACWWRDAALSALQQTGKRFRLLMTSESTSGIRAAVTAGLAVGILARSAVAPSMRILSEADGFPALPSSNLALLRNRNARSEVIDAMASAIEQEFRRLT